MWKRALISAIHPIKTNPQRLSKKLRENSRKLNILKFKKYNHQIPAPAMIYADFEAYQKKLNVKRINREASYTIEYTIHIPSGYAAYTKTIDDEKCPPKMEKFTAKSPDDNGSLHILTHLVAEVRDIYKIFLKDAKKMDPLTEEEKREYSNAKKCHICDGDITDYRILYKGKATHLRCVDGYRDHYDKI